MLAALTILSLVLPNFTTSSPGPMFNTPQLIFAGVISLVLYGSFVFVQTVRHRDYFLSIEPNQAESHPPPPSARITIMSFLFLLAALVAVVGIAKSLTPALERAIANFGAPKGVVGIVIAALVLLPEGLAAFIFVAVVP